MKLLSPTPHKRLNEVTGFLLLAAGLVMLLSLISYHTQDPSLDTASSARPLNLVGYPGAYLSDFFFQLFGATAFLFPLLTFLLAWRWIRSEEIEAGAIKLAGTITLTLSACAALSFHAGAAIQRQHSPGRHAGLCAGELSGGFAQSGRRGAVHGDGGNCLCISGFDVHIGESG